MNQHAERLDWLWRKGSVEAVVSALDKVEDMGERGALYGRAFNVAQRWRPAVARFIGERYVDAYYQTREPFGAAVRPDARLLWDLMDLYERDGNGSMAQWVCEVAAAFQLGDAERDFDGKLASLRGCGELQGS